MNYRVLVGLSVVVAFAAVIGAWGQSLRQDEFDHLRHQRVFPTCEGCHRIEATGVTMPEPTFCARCHDGQIVRRVDWSGHTPRASNLNFDHARVIEAKKQALGIELPCATCHTPQGGERMDVKRAVVNGCLGCHAAGRLHYVDAPCAKCHVPLAEAKDLSMAQVAELPVPPDHADETFRLGHGQLAEQDVARCSVCHARESCSSCHANAPSVSAIQTLASDPRAAEIARQRDIVYPTPASHRSEHWLEAHGESVEADASNCATCHTQTSCQSCHVEPAPAPVGQLPPARAAGLEVDTGQERGPGVELERRAPRSHTPTFLGDHRAVAAAATSQCEACHARNECISCHTGSEALARPGDNVARYHPANFMEAHSAAAFGQRVECATCHNTEAFCRSCHVDLGMGASGRIDTGFHNEDPRWIFGHGQAARQALESCASCHGQRDCLVCHSAVGGRRINPHGPGFDADKLRSKNPELCLFCHLSSILER